MTAKSNIEEQLLVKELRKGNRKVQRALYEHHKVKFFGLCRMYSKTKQDAEDQLQEAFVKIFKEIKAYKSKGSFEGWMRRIVVNTCLTHIRKEKKRYLTEELSDIPDVPAEIEEIKIGNDPNERAQAIIRLVQQLPLMHQTVFNLKVMEEYKFTEIAELLEMNESTVRSHFRRARKKLQNLLDKSLMSK